LLAADARILLYVYNPQQVAMNRYESLCIAIHSLIDYCPLLSRLPADYPTHNLNRYSAHSTDSLLHLECFALETSFGDGVVF